MAHFGPYVGFSYVVRRMASGQGGQSLPHWPGTTGRFGRLRRRAGGARRKERGLSKRIVATLGVVAILAALVALGTSGPASGAEPKTLQNAVRDRLKAPQIPVMKNGRQVGTKRSSFLSSGLLKAAEEVDNKAA
jgi:hypothetical protein